MDLDIRLIRTAPDLIAIALDERLRLAGKKVLITGKDAAHLSKNIAGSHDLDHPLELEAENEYDYIIAIQSLELFNEFELLRIGDKLYYDHEHELQPLPKNELHEAKEFIKKTRLHFPDGEKKNLALELYEFIEKAQKALKKGGSIIFIDFTDPNNVKHIASLFKLKSSSQPFHTFLERTDMAKMRVVNGNTFFSHSPSPATEEHVLEIMKGRESYNKVTPYIELEKRLSESERELIRPYITRFALVFEDWSNFMKSLIFTARKLEKDLGDRHSVLDLYSTLFILSEKPESDFEAKAWLKSQEIGKIPHVMNLFVVSCMK